MPTCLECFIQHEHSCKDLAATLEREHADFSCEKSACSQYSPGIVQDEEELAFLLIDPLHYDEGRKTVLPQAFEQLGRNDLSTLRLSVADVEAAKGVREELIARGKDKLPPKLRLVNEVCLGSVEKIRAVVIDDTRAMGVFDTALEKNVGHASIMTDLQAFSDKSRRFKVRERLHSIMAGNRISFEALLQRLAPNLPKGGINQ